MEVDSIKETHCQALTGLSSFWLSFYLKNKEILKKEKNPGNSRAVQQ